LPLAQKKSVGTEGRRDRRNIGLGFEIRWSQLGEGPSSEADNWGVSHKEFAGRPRGRGGPKNELLSNIRKRTLGGYTFEV